MKSEASKKEKLAIMGNMPTDRPLSICADSMKNSNVISFVHGKSKIRIRDLVQFRESINIKKDIWLDSRQQRLEPLPC